jgi:hypothetical protein
MLDILALSQQDDHVFQCLRWFSVQDERLRFLYN